MAHYSDSSNNVERMEFVDSTSLCRDYTDCSGQRFYPISLRNDIYAAVRRFQGDIKIHLRKYKSVPAWHDHSQQKFLASEKGICLSPEEFERLVCLLPRLWTSVYEMAEGKERLPAAVDFHRPGSIGLMIPPSIADYDEVQHHEISARTSTFTCVVKSEGAIKIHLRKYQPSPDRRDLTKTFFGSTVKGICITPDELIGLNRLVPQLRREIETV